MPRVGTLEDRFHQFIDDEIAPTLEDLGFGPAPGVLASRNGVDVVWLLDIDIAPWANARRVVFTIEWGVFVPGLHWAMGEEEPSCPTLDVAVVRGWAGRLRPKAEPTWFSLGDQPWPIGAIAARIAARGVLASMASDVLPALERLGTAGDLQHHLHRELDHGRGMPTTAELRGIAQIAAISALLGEQENARRWLDHLAERSAAAMTPEVVAERLTPMRERCLAG